MDRRNTTRMTCTCGGYWFPLRQGSLFCWNRTNSMQRYPRDPDIVDRDYGSLAAT
jgi:hypothetical protein